MNSLTGMAEKGKAAAKFMALASSTQKNEVLLHMADVLLAETDTILTANAVDLENAKQNGMAAAQIDRLTLTEARIQGIAEGVRQVVTLNDPTGEYKKMETRPNGLVVGQKRVPLGLIGIIYESRPNVTVDAAVLCLKAGNAVLLRGGKEAINSNRKLVEIIRKALTDHGFPEDCVCLVQNTSRESAMEMMNLTGYLDVLIPRGGAGLIQSVVANAKVPVIETGVGNCHIYVDDSADLAMAAEIICNAKCSRPSVCNAAENLLVAESVAEAFLPMMKERLDEYHVELRGCDKTRAILGDEVVPATEEDYYKEFLDYILAVKVVSGVDEAIDFINTHSSGHSEAIVTESYTASQKFLNAIDAAAVYVNASTRFTDGYEFGLGAEIGISTQKLHARGPMGLEQLTSVKHVIYGSGQVRW